MTRLFSILFVGLLTSCRGQTQNDSLIFPKNARLPDKFQTAIKEQTNEYDRLFYSDSAKNKHYPMSFMLDKIDNDSNYQYIFLAEYWIAFHYRELFHWLH